MKLVIRLPVCRLQLHSFLPSYMRTGLAFIFFPSPLSCLFVSIDLTAVNSCWARGNRKCVNKLTSSLQLLLITSCMNMNGTVRERREKKTLSQQWHRWMTIHLLHDATRPINTLMYSCTSRKRESLCCFHSSWSLLVRLIFELFLHPCKMLVVRRDCHDEAKYLIRKKNQWRKRALRRECFYDMSSLCFLK